MANITGTTGNDVLNGTVDADRIEGGAGNDRINAGAGDDEILGGQGADILTGDAGNDRIYGEDGNDGVFGGGGNDLIEGGAGDDTLIGDGGNDTIRGGVGNDRLFGSAGNDTLEGGAGNDAVNGEAGDDTIVWRSGDGTDVMSGGAGNDRLEIVLTSADVTADLRDDLAAYKAWAAGQAVEAGSQANLATQTTGSSFTFESIGLTISVLETVAITVDGRAVAIDDLINAAPQAAAAVALATREDGALEGVIAATDPDGDALTFSVESGPTLGSITLDAATGAFVYTPASNASGNDVFVVRITDPSGASTTQSVAVTVAAAADAPSVSVNAATVALAQPLIGTEKDDVLAGDTAPEWVTVELGIDAALTDTDGSEQLSISIAGVPADATLSAGAKQSDGTWLLTGADLRGLSMTARTATDLALTVTATSAEAAGGTAATAAVLTVTFDRTGLGDDVIEAGAGNDVIDGGKGNDKLLGGDGDDRFIQTAGYDSDYISGGEGKDVVELALSASDLTPDFLTELAKFEDWLGNGAAGEFSFGSLGLTVETIEDLVITVDGKEISRAELLNVAPEAAAYAAFATDEDTALNGRIGASDANGDSLTFAIESGPARGTVKIDAATGAFVYVGGKNVSGNDSFTVRVSDQFGASALQTVQVAVAAKADGPELAVTDAVVEAPRGPTTHVGTRGNDSLRGDQSAPGALVKLDIAARLSDLDGSENLSVRIDGVPAEAALSAGVRQSDGSWVLAASDLANLSLSTPSARDIALQVTATATDGDSTATSTARMNVSFKSAAGINDTFVASGGTDTYDGVTGTDTVDFSSMTTSVSVDLDKGTGSGPGRYTFLSIENVIGTSGSDTIKGNAADNLIEAGAGNDRVEGGAGNDRFIAGLGNDRYDGGTGYDVLDYSKATRGITVNDGSVSGSGTGSDTYKDVEKVIGTSFNDVFQGGKGNDAFEGGAGNDWFRGFEGSDVFTGGAGADTFMWTLRDFVSGNKSQGVDVITDFDDQDTIDLTGITFGLVRLMSWFGMSPDGLIKATDTAQGTMISMRSGSSFYNVVLLEDVHGVTTRSLLAEGQLIA